jgi:hypothetical protein
MKKELSDKIEQGIVMADKAIMNASGCCCSEEEQYVCLFCKWEEGKKWKLLTLDEQVKALAYKRVLNTNKVPSKLMRDFMNNLHKKYPDFHVGVIP